MSPFREAAPRVVEPVERHKGPREKCPMCGAHKRAKCSPCGLTSLAVNGVDDWSCPRSKNHTVLFERLAGAPGACWLGAPIGIFRRCREPGIHLHQSCKVCGHAWVCDPLEAS